MAGSIFAEVHFEALLAAAVFGFLLFRFRTILLEISQFRARMSGQISTRSLLVLAAAADASLWVECGAEWVEFVLVEAFLQTFGTALAWIR